MAGVEEGVMAKSPFGIVLSEEEARELRARAARYTTPHAEVLSEDCAACRRGSDERGDRAPA